MMKIRRTYFNRRQLKSSEGEFIEELKNSYKLSPKLSSLILLKAKECLLREYSLKEGRIEIRGEARKNNRNLSIKMRQKII
jgi:hypothetical protein